jgi:hypothetical protein
MEYPYLLPNNYLILFSNILAMANCLKLLNISNDKILFFGPIMNILLVSLE